MKKNDLRGSIILFDLNSNSQKKFTQFIAKKAKKNTLSFIAFQSEIGQVLVKKLNLSRPQLSSIILLEKGKYYTQSAALLKLTKYLEGFLALATIFLTIPKVIIGSFRNIGYSSKNGV